MVIPFIVTVVWILFFIFTFPFEQPKTESKRKISKLKPNHIKVKAQKYDTVKGVFTEYDKIIDLKKTVVYIDMWRSHWCTYYNDREFFFTPRINEIAQRMRKVGVPVVEISLNIDSFSPNAVQRKRGKQIVKKGMNNVLETYNARAALYHKYYIPGFKDVCVYEDQTRFGKYRDNCLTKKIAVTDDDYFVSSFKESAEAFVGLGAKHVIVLGQHTNMCLMAVFLYCREVGLDLIIVRDLVDGCWIYDLQKEHCKTHTEGNKAINRYFEKEFGSSILSYDLIRTLQHTKLQRIEQNYTRFTNHAYMFKWI